jgi:nitrous oxide reductase
MEKYNIKELEEKIKKYRYIKVNETNIDDVDELSEIKISGKKSKEEKILDFISKTKNPYIFKVNNKLVKIECNDNGTNAEEAITNVIKSIYR